MSDFRNWVLLTGFVAPVFLTGCDKQLASAEFLQRYEKQCAVSLKADDFNLMLLYESPEYLAVSTSGGSLGPSELASLKEQYGKVHYIRISIRPALNAKPGAVFTPDFVDQQAELGRRLELAQSDFGRLISLQDGKGDMVSPIAVSFQKGIGTGATNSIIAIFPKENQGRKVDLEKSDLVIEDFGLNLGTLRSRLVLPKGFRLKVAA